MISISMTKKAPDAIVEEDELRKDGKKSWKILRLIYIVTDFFIVIKKLQKIDKNFCIDLIKR